MPLDHATLESLAPDQASLNAARKLLAVKKWPTLEEDDALIWGLCQGSGSTPYRTVFDKGDYGYKCTCPSRKFPCKHALALAWMRIDSPEAFAPGERPDWVLDWLGRRRPKSGADGASAGSEDDTPKPRRSIAATRTAPEPEKTAEEIAKAEARAAKARARNRANREKQILAGLDELDVWIGDRLAAGAAASVDTIATDVRPIARRLADAKAPGLATRLEALPERLLDFRAGPLAARGGTEAVPMRLVEELGMLHLIAEAYRRQADLDPLLRTDVRRAVGWTTSRTELEEDPETERVRGAWSVLAVRQEDEPGRLRRFETWVHGADGRDAVLIDHVPISSGGSAGGFAIGATFEAELLFFPSVVPLRAVISADGAREVEASVDVSTRTSLGEALDTMDEVRSGQPWLGVWPLHVRDVSVRFDSDGHAWLAGDDRALPLAADAVNAVRPLSAVASFDGFVLVDGGVAELHQACTALGTWTSE